MEHKQFTLSFTEGNELPVKIPDGFDTIEQAKKWVDKEILPYYLFTVTEWDIENIDFYGTPEIVAQVNLQAPIDEGQTDLPFYATF